MSEKFKIGDVVNLKLGTQVMIVEGYDVNNENLVKCFWQKNDKNYHEAFHEDMLELEDPDKYNIITV